MRDSEDWRPIKTAPRDGTVIEIWADGIMAIVARWDKVRSVWVEKGFPAIWSEGDGYGPSHWRPVYSRTVEKVMRQ